MGKKYSLAARINEVTLELNFRRKVYKGLVATQKMKQAEADIRIEIMEDVLNTLLWLQKNEKAIVAAVEKRE